MARQYFLYSLFLWQFAQALSIPQHGAQQQPLIPERQRAQAYPYPTTVILEFTESGSDQQQRFEIPLGARISSERLPSHPSLLKIVAVTNEQGQPVPLEELKHYVCQIEPKISVEEAAALKSGLKQKVWPWFTFEDKSVQMEQSTSRWFLGGRAIESYECR